MANVKCVGLVFEYTVCVIRYTVAGAAGDAKWIAVPYTLPPDQHRHTDRTNRLIDIIFIMSLCLLCICSHSEMSAFPVCAPILAVTLFSRETHVIDTF